MNQGSGNRYALHLAAGELEGLAGGVVFDLDPAEGVFGERAGVVAAREHKREFDIFNHGERGEELEGLENESNFIAAEFREGRVVERRGIDAIERDGARGGKIHGAGEV